MSTSIAEPSPRAPAALPLLAELAAADRIVQQEKAGRFILRAWPWVFAAVPAAFAVDVLLHLSALLRVTLLASWLVSIAAFLLVGAWIAWGRRNSAEHTARVLECRNPQLGSRLINVLQLRAQSVDPSVAPLTRELAALAVAGATDELRAFRLQDIARTDQVAQEARRLGLATAGFALLLAVAWPITRVEGPRFLDPFGDHPAYSFTQLSIVEPSDDSAAIIYGQGVTISAEARGHLPHELFLALRPAAHPEAHTLVPMFRKGDADFTQHVQPVTSDLIATVQTRDGRAVSPQRRIAVILTPRLESAAVTITPPAYTGLGPEERPLQFKSLRALVGSTVNFRLTSNRPLASGRISVANESGTVVPLTLEPRTAQTVTGSLVVQENAQLRFSLMDIDGIGSQEKWELALIATHDLAPEVRVTNPDADTFVALDFKAEPAIEASDDFGISTLRIHVGRNDVFGEPRTFSYEKPTTRVRETLAFDFPALGVVPGDRLSIFAETIDTAPEPHLARSKTVTLTVISVEEYNAFIREQTDLTDIEARYSQLLQRLHEQAERQQHLAEQAEALRQQTAQAQTEDQKAAAAQQLGELQAQQQRLNDELEKTAERMENFVRQQPLYDLEAELQAVLAEKAGMIRESVARNDAARSPQPSPDQQTAPAPEALAGFQKAAEEQAERLAGVEKQAQQQIQEPLQDLSLVHEIVKDMNRFKELYAAQQELALQTRAYDRPTALQREDQLALRDLAARQKEIGDQLDAVEQKLWEDGQAARDKFPKAARSAQDLAQKMGDLRLQSLSGKATNAMLAGDGTKGAQLADNLGREMEKLFSQCEGREGEMNSELDGYLTLQRSMKPGNSFRQMLQTRKFGSGRTPGLGSGNGVGGRAGYAIITGPQANVLGGEQRVTEAEKAGRKGSVNQAGVSAESASTTVDGAQLAPPATPVNRESTAIPSEAGLEAYGDLVDRYFKAITKPQEKKP